MAKVKANKLEFCGGMAVLSFIMGFFQFFPKT